MPIECVTLRDTRGPATARVAVGFGFNCCDFEVGVRGGSIPILWSAPDFFAGTARPSSSGIPILFPFPGRLHGSRFPWNGREYHLQPGDAFGNAIHGFVLSRPWRIVDQRPDTLTGEFHASRDDPSLLEQWPADFRIRVEYHLEALRLSCRIVADNPDSRPLPCGLGLHPYFRVPLGGSMADLCRVRLPVTEQWELRDMVTTGGRSAVANAAALQAGEPFGSLQFDNVFTGLVVAENRVRSSIRDPASGVVVELSFDSGFRECVVYTPAHRQAICIEPYTCAPGCFQLKTLGIDAGGCVLAPGESWTMRAEIQVSERAE